MDEEKRTWPFDPASTAAVEGWGARPWPFTPRSEPAISFEGLVAEEKSSLCYVFRMANAEEPAEKALIASSRPAITSQDSVNRNFVTIMVDNGASDHYFNDSIILNLKHCLQDCVHLATPHKILTAGGILLDGTVENVLQGLVTDDNDKKIFVRFDIVVVSGIGRNPFSIRSAAKRAL